MMKNKHLACAFACAFTFGSLPAAFGQITVSMSPMTSFGGGDGWLTGAELSILGSNATRSIAYSRASGNLYVATRDGGTSVRILDASSGLEIGALDTGSVSGGFFAINMIGADDDGAIYGANLTLEANTNAFKVYKWDSDIFPPNIVYEGIPALFGATLSGGRLGDTFDVTGSGNNVRVAAGYANTAITEDNTYALIAPNIDPFLATGTAITFGNPAPAQGAFRLGITFAGADKVVGSQGSGGFNFTTYNEPLSTGTLDLARTLTNVNERPMDYAIVNGVPLLATLEANGNTDTPAATFSTVRIYSLFDPANPELVGSGRTAAFWTSQGSSAPGTGSVAWGEITGATATLYAMNTLNGIQAFEVMVIPEPSTAALLGLTTLALAARRRRR